MNLHQVDSFAYMSRSPGARIHESRLYIADDVDIAFKGPQLDPSYSYGFQCAEPPKVEPQEIVDPGHGKYCRALCKLAIQELQNDFTADDVVELIGPTWDRVTISTTVSQLILLMGYKSTLMSGRSHRKAVYWRELDWQI